MYCPTCIGQVEMTEDTYVGHDEKQMVSVCCPVCSFTLATDTHSGLLDAVSTLWCFMPRRTGYFDAKAQTNALELQRFVERLERATPAENWFDLFFNEAMEADTVFAPTLDQQLRGNTKHEAVIQMHGIRAVDKSTAGAMSAWFLMAKKLGNSARMGSVE